jgi:AraC-like DNA-binding protein
MSHSGQGDEDEVEWRIDTREFRVPDRVEWESHVHPDRHELLWGSRGVLTADTDDGYFAVPSALGLWIPAGVAHRVAASRGTAFRCTYVDLDAVRERTRTAAVAMPTVVRALLDRLNDPPYLAAGPRKHAEELVLALLSPVELAPVDLPLPSDGRTRQVAESILLDPADGRGIGEWGRFVGASPRNLSRLFRVETGMGFSAWRTRARMRRAVEWLAADQPVASVSRRAGYATPSAFVQAFRREIGVTPGEFAAGRGRSDEDSA